MNYLSDLAFLKSACGGHMHTVPAFQRRPGIQKGGEGAAGGAEELVSVLEVVSPSYAPL